MSKQKLSFKSSSDHPAKIVQRGSGGIGFFGLLTVLFVGLKLTGVISWPWLLVICPIFVPIAIGLTIIAIGLLFIAIAAIITGIRKGFKKEDICP